MTELQKYVFAKQVYTHKKESVIGAYLTVILVCAVCYLALLIAP